MYVTANTNPRESEAPLTDMPASFVLSIRFHIVERFAQGRLPHALVLRKERLRLASRKLHVAGNSEYDQNAAQAARKRRPLPPVMFRMRIVPGLGLRKVALAPEEIDRGIDEQLHQERREEAADHGRGDALHDVGTGAGRPHDRDETEEGAGHGHHLRPDALHG